MKPCCPLPDLRNIPGSDGQQAEGGILKFIIRGAMLLALAATTTGCANKGGYVQMYKGAALPPVQVGFLKGVYEYRKGSAANETIRIVSIDGLPVPRQFGVAEGANLVSILPGQYDVKLFYVHASNIMDYYTYSTLRINVQPNCIYQFYSKLSVNKKDIFFSVMPSPASQAGNQDCGFGVVAERQQRA